MMNCYRMTTRWEFGHEVKIKKSGNLWVGDKAQRECQWRHVCLRDTPRYERQWQHSCLRGTSQCAHLQPHLLSVVRILLGSVVVFSSSRTHGLWLKFESFMSSPWPSTCVRSHLDPPFLLLALLSTPFPLPQLHEVCGRPAQLLQRECGLYWLVLPLHRLWAQGPWPLRDLSRALRAAPGLAAALLQQSLFCGPRLRWRYTRRHAPSSTSSASLSLSTRRLVCQSVVVVNVR